MLRCFAVTVQRLSHIGICVTDVERSLAFYRDALGFVERLRLDVDGEDPERLIGLPGVRVRAVFLERDGTCIELLKFEVPGESGGPGPRPMNQPGLTHLSLRVESLDAAIAAVTAQGGGSLPASRIASRRFGTAAIFVTDPDGLRIELLEAPGDPAVLPGEAPAPRES